jgi:hypothetical protein
MSSNTTITKPQSDSGLLFWLSQYDSLVIFGGFGILVLVTIILTGLFHAGPIVRTNLLFNAAGGLLMGFAFIFIILRFMGAKIVILGKSFDVGMIVYIFIVCFVIFILGN